jgi:hypothetical protein
METISALYAGASDMFVRPPRTNYAIEMLGPPRFRVGSEYFVREDIQVGGRSWGARY